MSLVLDCSITLAWLFAYERPVIATQILIQAGEAGAVVPSLWRLEVANGLQMAVRRKRIDAAFRDNAILRLGMLAITVDTETDHHAWAATLQLAERHNLTLYDAAYLELAQRRGLPLATLDRELGAAGNMMGISVLGY